GENGAGENGAGDEWLDALRAVCGAVWAAADAAEDAGGTVVDRASVDAALDEARITRAPARPY
ncbi:hypothetical protein DY240_12010, partial [Jiangella rhizosphaerae]